MLLNVIAAFVALAPAPPTADAGNLTAVGKDGKTVIECPLERTSVNAYIAGFGARVTVVQTFSNTSTTPIEAVYTFPLPADAAVDRMRMEVGKRIIEGVIKRREEARRIYDAARAQGQTAALLNQERPNIFTQNVANIMPGDKVRVEISYSEILPYDHGQLEFQFPMVVGPHYLGNARDPNAISPSIIHKGTRTGTNIDLTVNLQAGAQIQSMESVLHQVNMQKTSPTTAIVKLTKRDEIPNRDFVLRYRLATDQVQSAFLTHVDPDKGGFFSLVFLPPVVPVATQIAPRELIFVMDQSGSQSGFPIEKSKEVTLKLIHAMRPGDTFNVLAFSNDVRALWRTPRPNTPENVAEAEKYIKPMVADGGTELRKAVVAALDIPEDPQRLRLVLFNTDGFVGDEKMILDSIQKHRRTSRVFTFGIGNSVNHFLIDAMSAEGRGASCTVTLNEKADGVVQQFLERTQTPVLTNIEARMEGVSVSDILPAHFPDVFAGRPVVVYGRYAGSGPGRVALTGKLGGEPWTQTMQVDFPARADAPALMGLWARRHVDDLVTANWLGQIAGDERMAKTDEIVDTALEFGIMTEYTSFVAVEPRVVNIGGRSRTVRVPVEMADGVSYEMGRDEKRLGSISSGVMAPAQLSQLQGVLVGGKGNSGSSGGFGGGGNFGGGGGVSGRPSRPSSTTGGLPIILPSSPSDKVERAEPLTPAEIAQRNYTHKVARNLRLAKGPVAVEIFLDNVSPETLKALTDLGLKADVVDKKLRLVLGTCEAAILSKLCQIEAVKRIEPLE